MNLQDDRSNDSMSSTGRFFVIGPPVQHVPAVRNVIKRALEVTSQGEEDYEFTKLEDPLRFASAWTDASHRVLRPGMGLAEIWTGLVSWKNSSLPRSFSCIVMDQQYLVEKNKGVDHRPPTFETFVVAVMFEGQRGVSQVYEWRARAEDGWRQRCSWLQELDLRKLHQDHRQALALLATPTWRLLHDVDRMFTAPHFLRTSRRARITRFWNRWGCIAVKHPPPSGHDSSCGIATVFAEFALDDTKAIMCT